jgi:cell division septation protein DedD
MVGPSPQDIRPQESQVPPNVGPGYHPQQPYHPAAVGAGGYMQQPYPPSQGMGGQGDSKKNKTIVSIGNFSLLAIIFSLILFGTFTFLGGFLLGMWLESPPRLPVTVEKENVSLFPPVAPSSQPQVKDAKPEGSTEQQSKIADILGDTVGEAVSDAQTPDVPDFLTPLITEAQDAASQQAASKTQRAVEQVQGIGESSSPSQSSQPQSSQPQSSVQPQTAAQPQSPISAQRHGLLPTQTSPGAPSPSPLSSPLPSSATQPLSQGKGDYSVQLGVYAAKENAEALKDNLQALNYTTYITPGKSSDGSTLYYVHSGSYKNYATATEAASQFTSRNIPGAIVIKISKNGNDAS